MNIKYGVVIAVVTLVLGFMSCQSTVYSVKVIKPKAYAAAIENKKVTLIDVRTPEEFAAGHLPGAININVNHSDFVNQIQAYNKKQPIYIYCQSGKRSSKASEMMKELGFKEIIDLKNGYNNWTGSIIK
jgi:rhodanese-related sulfurtransferase